MKNDQTLAEGIVYKIENDVQKKKKKKENL